MYPVPSSCVCVCVCRVGVCACRAFGCVRACRVCGCELKRLTIATSAAASLVRLVVTLLPQRHGHGGRRILQQLRVVHHLVDDLLEGLEDALLGLGAALD